MLFKDMLIEMWGEAFSKKIKSGKPFTVGEIDSEVKVFLFEINFWSPVISTTPNGFNIKTDDTSSTFSIMISKIKDDVYGVKFGDASDDYRWETNNLLKLKKAHFLKDVAKKIIAKKFLDGEFHTLVFAPQSSDGREEDRINLFKHLISEIKSSINKGELEFKEDDENFNGAMSLTYIK